MDDDVGSVQWSGEMFLPYPTIPYIISTGNSFWAAYSLVSLVGSVGWGGEEILVSAENKVSSFKRESRRWMSYHTICYHILPSLFLTYIISTGNRFSLGKFGWVRWRWSVIFQCIVDNKVFSFERESSRWMSYHTIP